MGRARNGYEKWLGCFACMMVAAGAGCRTQASNPFTVHQASKTTTEAGGQAQFTLALGEQPTSNVVISVTSSRPSEGEVSTGSLTFTKDNWRAPQTVTVTGVDDDLADGAQEYQVVFGAAQTKDAAFAGQTPAPLDFLNTDDDSAGITVSTADGNTTEAGGQAHFSVVLNSQPKSEVTVHFASSNVAEGSLTVSSLTFTTVNWRAPQRVTVTGVDDDEADGNQTYEVDFQATTSSDAAYAALTPSPIVLLNIDDETAGFTVSAASGNTTEAGAEATFSVSLSAKPSANVTVHFDSNFPAEGTVRPKSFTFTKDNWNAPQTATVTGVDDFVADGDQPYAIVFSSTTSDDAAYAVLTPPSVSLTNVDNDSAGITVSAASGNTTEAGGQATFNVALTSQPLAEVALHFASNDPTEGTLSTESLTFTPSNWSAPQTVTLTGVDDFVADGNQPYAVVFAATTSDDPSYAGRTPANVTLLNLDDDSVGITVSAADGNTTESGGQAHVTLVLTSQPVADVTLHFASNDTTEGTLSTDSLTFTTSNWNAAQTVTLTGVNDFIADGNQPYAIVFSATTSADPAYAGLTPDNVPLLNLDDDHVGFLVSALSGDTTEAGGEATLTVQLSSQPLADVQVSVSSSDTTEGTVSPSALTFTAATWNQPQTVTATGVDDLVADGNQPYSVVFSAATSADADYQGLTPSSVSLLNLDDDVAAIHVSDSSGFTTEGGGIAHFTVVLGSQPTADVTVSFDSNDLTEGTVSPHAFTFTPADYATPQTATLTGVDDSIPDGNVAYQVVFAATVSADPLYAAITPAPVQCINQDNDTAGVTAGPVSGDTTESGGTATFTLQLNSPPTADVTLHFASNNANEGVTNVTDVTFTSANWLQPQTVTVTGVDDAVKDGRQPYQVVFTATTSADPGYAGLVPESITLFNDDND